MTITRDDFHKAHGFFPNQNSDLTVIENLLTGAYDTNEQAKIQAIRTLISTGERWAILFALQDIENPDLNTSTRMHAHLIDICFNLMARGYQPQAHRHENTSIIQALFNTAHTQVDANIQIGNAIDAARHAAQAAAQAPLLQYNNHLAIYHEPPSVKRRLNFDEVAPPTELTDEEANQFKQLVY
jgi:hypothetical protein